jgi:hypothetical protein
VRLALALAEAATGWLSSVSLHWSRSKVGVANERVADLVSRRVQVVPAADHGYGFMNYFEAFGGAGVRRYEPGYRKRMAAKPEARAKAAKRRPAQKRFAFGHRPPRRRR